jgi:hypothetical protein
MEISAVGSEACVCAGVRGGAGGSASGGGASISTSISGGWAAGIENEEAADGVGVVAGAFAGVFTTMR